MGFWLAQRLSVLTLSHFLLGFAHHRLADFKRDIAQHYAGFAGFAAAVLTTPAGQRTTL